MAWRGDLQAEIASEFAIREGCGMPGEADREDQNAGFFVWSPNKKNEERRSARLDPFFVIKRKRSRPKYREAENAAAREYRRANRDEINRRRREAYARKLSSQS